jgi:geranylgeranyl diphosphate synthase type I
VLTSADDPVVLLDAFGQAAGTLPKHAVHHAGTPFHLAFSCHVVDEHGRALLTRRAASKATFPATWSNACCGHPLPGETLRSAVTRRLAAELGLSPVRMGLALPDFTYRASLDGIVEHELCPVVIAEVAGLPEPDPDECDDHEWAEWGAVLDRADTRPETLSPWSVRQFARLARLAPAPGGPRAWLDEHAAGEGAVGLDSPLAEPHDEALAPVGVAAGAAAVSGNGSNGNGSNGNGNGNGSNGNGSHPDLGRLGGVGRLGASVPRPLATIDDCPSLAAVRGDVDDLLLGFLAERRAEAEALAPAVDEMGAEVRRLIGAGGKRLRPAFVYWGHRAGGAAHDPRVLAAAAAAELLHTFALVHDDVMDRSDRRRGDATAHVALAERHRAGGLTGDPDWFGVSAALLAGDLAFVWADQMLEASDLPAERLARARNVFTTLRSEVIGGQYLDLRLAHAPAATEDDALRVALLKSARYTVTRPLQLGAAVAGVDEATVGALTRYGDAVGLAFQMRDDVLGLFGDPDVTGKGCIDDLREGKRTLLVVRALALTEGADHDLLAGALGDPDLDEATAGDCCEVVARSGALASVEALLTAEHARALHAVEGVYPPARTALTQLADMAVFRWR